MSTAPKIAIENKFKDVVEIKSPCRLFFTSNRDQAVPVEMAIAAMWSCRPATTASRRRTSMVSRGRY